MEELVSKIKDIVSGIIYDLSNEKSTQKTIGELLKDLNVESEYRLSNKDIVDFFIEGLAIEVKVKGNAVAILRQCERYCEHEQVKGLLLITSRSMGFPKEINGKPCYYISLSKGML